MGPSAGDIKEQGGGIRWYAGPLAGWMFVAVIQTISNRDVSSQVMVEQGRTGQAIWHLLLEGEASLVQTSSGPCTESSPSIRRAKN